MWMFTNHADTYVKLTLMSPNGQEIARSKTSVRRGQPNPLYKETFMFQVIIVISSTLRFHFNDLQPVMHYEYDNKPQFTI